MEIVTKPMESRRCREDNGDNMCVDADDSLPGGQKNCQDDDDDNDDDANMKRTCQEGAVNSAFFSRSLTCSGCSPSRSPICGGDSHITSAAGGGGLLS